MICFADRRAEPRLVRSFPVILRWLDLKTSNTFGYRALRTLNVGAGGLLVLDNSSTGIDTGRRVSVALEVSPQAESISGQTLVLQGRGEVLRIHRIQDGWNGGVAYAIAFERPLALGSPVLF